MPMIHGLLKIVALPFFVCQITIIRFWTPPKMCVRTISGAFGLAEEFQFYCEGNANADLARQCAGYTASAQ